MPDMRSALLAVGASQALAVAWCEPMAAAAALHDITTPRRLAAWVAQCAHETDGFKQLEEDLGWRDAVRLDGMFSAVRGVADAQSLIRRGPEAIANRVYAGRNGNRLEASGDGWRYRGRGALMLTGRANYAAAGADLRRPYVDQPELLLQPGDAALSASWFWVWKGCNAMADAGDIAATTRAVNGAAMDRADRRAALYRRALTAFA